MPVPVSNQATQVAVVRPELQCSARKHYPAVSHFFGGGTSMPYFFTSFRNSSSGRLRGGCPGSTLAKRKKSPSPFSLTGVVTRRACIGSLGSALRSPCHVPSGIYST